MHNYSFQTYVLNIKNDNYYKPILKITITKKQKPMEVIVIFRKLLTTRKNAA